MNKTLRIIFIILLSMLAVGIGIVFVKLLTGNGFLNFSFNRFESKELVIEEVYDNIFENININSEEGNIYIEQSNDDKIKVVVYGKKEISEATEKHRDWINELKSKYTFNEENVLTIIKEEIGKTYAKILENAGVYKMTDEGIEHFKKFTESL